MPEHSNTSRPPVVAIMGHIDHGKSTLLSYIRKSKAPLNEAGGITQHISAYEVSHIGKDKVEHSITFLDTPGHEAFSGIRNRGAQVADVAILVVAADDGVKPQTVEAYKQIQSSKTPFIVAINKIDKADANIEKTKQSLAEHGIFIESYGGDIPAVEMSAKTGVGIPELLDMIILISELEELTGDPSAPAEGVIIESNRDDKKGISATCIIKNGTVHKGMFVVSGEAVAPVRIMENFLGKHIDTASFSSPVSIIGWDALPLVGDTFTTYADRESARQAQEQQKSAMYTKKNGATSHTDPSDATSTHLVPLIIKADTGGSLEAVLYEISKLGETGARPLVLLSSIGTISENDVLRAIGSQAIIVSFHTDVDSPARHLAMRSNIEIQNFDIIYKLTEWLTETLKTRTPKVETEELTGRAKVLKIFSKTKDRQILGAKVEEGALTLGSIVKIVRRDAEIGRGKIKELQQAKNKTDEVKEGVEFGAMVEAKIEIAAGDRLESFIMISK